MATTKLTIAKIKNQHPQTKTPGYTARLVTAGTADYEQVTELASRHTTIHPAELKMALELCMDSVATLLAQGYIIDLGPVGKLYPACTSRWVEQPDALFLSTVRPTIHYRAAPAIARRLQAATLTWATEETDGIKES